METESQFLGEPKQKIVIDRSKWRTGGNSSRHHANMTGEGFTELRNREGFMCCLGFVCQQALQLPDETVTNRCYPRSLSYHLRTGIRGLSIPKVLWDGKHDDDMYDNTYLADEAARINDNGRTTPQEKEAKLLLLFANSPYELEFVGNYTFTTRGIDE